MFKDTIAAIASGLSVGGISVIRISGDAAFSIAEKIFAPASGRSFSELCPYSVTYGHIKDNNKVIDEVMVLKLPAPKTYTREDTVEIDCHGGIVVTKRVLDLVIENGARPADPGEFTKRAFLNGRIDLSQAEAVIDIINSKSEMALKNAMNQLRGDIQQKIEKLRDRIIHNTAYIEAALDDPEHYDLTNYPDALRSEVEALIEEINKLIASSENGRIIKEGISTVILGKPNAGKSSLLNLLLGEDRAIVTDIAGTTRDTLKETLQLDGLLLNIVDTAGIRSTEDVIEQMGVNRAIEEANSADLIIYVVDSSRALDDNDRQILELIKDKKAIVLLNKTDLETVVSAEEIGLPAILFSTVDKSGYTELITSIKDMFFAGEISFDNEIYISNARQKNLLNEALFALKQVLISIDSGMPEDFFSIDLMTAYEKLGNITGSTVEDDLADRIFSEFCMGK